MPKDSTYHRSAIQYNEALAVVAEEQADLVEDPEVKKWCRSVGKQHRFHAKRHRSALAKLDRAAEADSNLTPEPSSVEVSIADDADTGKYVTEETVEDPPATSVTEETIAQEVARLNTELNDGRGI